MQTRTPAKKPNPAIRAVAETQGGIPNLAKHLNVSEVTVYQWANGVRPVPPLRAIEMDELSVGSVPCEQITPEWAARFSYLRTAAKKTAKRAEKNVSS